MNTIAWTKARASQAPFAAASPAGLNDRTYIRVSHRTPTATWQPWVPVRVKKVVPRMLFVIVRCFSNTKLLNSYTWQPRKMLPKRMVVRIEARRLRRLPFWIAFTARAIMSEDIRRMNVENDVSSMLNTWRADGTPGGGCRR